MGLDGLSDDVTDDPYGESFYEPPPVAPASSSSDAAAFCSGDTANTYVGQFMCGLAQLSRSAGDTLRGVTANAATAAQGVAGAAAYATNNVFNPQNAGAAGAGLGIGLVLAGTGVGVVGAVAVDQLMFGGAGWKSIARRWGR